MTETAPILDLVRTAEVKLLVGCSTTVTDSRATWEQALDSTYCELGVTWPSEQQEFSAAIAAQALGDGVSVSVVRAHPHTVIRTPDMIRSDPGADFILCLITNGTARMSQAHHGGNLVGGSFGLVDSSRPFTIAGDTTFEQIVVRISRHLLEARVTDSVIDSVVGHPVRPGGVGDLAASFLTDITTCDLTYNADRHVIASALLDLVAVTLCRGSAPTSVTDLARREDLHRIKQVLQRDLARPVRPLDEIGSELGMSTRYIYKLFSTEGTTPRAWINAKKCDKAKTLLAATKLDIAQIGCSVGIPDPSQFSRVFSRYVGRSPSLYRAENWML
ncbi:AraC family transcriptional regulator [Gordonia westfalica]|uniref:AraC family transcriptional regulator n=1 Tax=Gordonia westfalica TaxID=158898 RepID=A0ABU2GZY4_9ACTN|nr:AraC family transcriptional regulator [Gordonia westfalica]MDS1117024.1 AraC family transcriptional regulator [Gordonia westfalica]